MRPGPLLSLINFAPITVRRAGRKSRAPRVTRSLNRRNARRATRARDSQNTEIGFAETTSSRENSEKHLFIIYLTALNIHTTDLRTVRDNSDTMRKRHERIGEEKYQKTEYTW